MGDMPLHMSDELRKRMLDNLELILKPEGAKGGTTVEKSAKLYGGMHRVTKKGRVVGCEMGKLGVFGVDSTQDGTTWVGIEMAHEAGKVTLVVRPGDADEVAHWLAAVAEQAKERGPHATQAKATQEVKPSTADAVIEAAGKLAIRAQALLGTPDYLVPQREWSDLVRALQAHEPGWGKRHGIL